MSDGLPPAGWYPDPLERHAERFWDGTEWSERVRDGSLESADPLYAPQASSSQAQDTDVAGAAGDVGGRSTAGVDPLDELLASTSGAAADAFDGGDPLEELTSASVVTGSGPAVHEVAEEVFGTTFDREPMASDPAGIAALPAVDPFAPAATDTEVDTDGSVEVPEASAGAPAAKAARSSARPASAPRRGPALIGAIVGGLGVLLLLAAGGMLLGASADTTTADVFTVPAGLVALGLGLGLAGSLLRR